MRARSDPTPILFCTARDDEVARVLGLESGGDDYITKPFSPREVVARVRAVLRRVAAGREPALTESLTAGDVVLRPAARTVDVGGAPVHLTATEFDLLARLMRTPGIVIPRDRLLEEVWGYSNAVPTRTVDVHVAQVRAKLARPELIETVRGIGYRLRARA
jgi:DNA-binding response OmpR family regulator